VTQAVPAGWRMVCLSDILDFKNGLNKAKRFFGTGTPIVNFTDVLCHPLLSRSAIRGCVTLEAQERRRFSACRGDVFFTRTSESVEEIGTASVLIDDIPKAVFSGFVLRGRPRTDELDPVFLAYCLRSSAVRAQIMATATYTTRALTNTRLLGRVRLLLPPLEEQRRIVGALVRTDNLIVSLQRSLVKQKLIQQGIMQQLFTGKTRLPGFCGSWRTVRLGDHVRYLKTVALARAELDLDSPLRYLHYGDIHNSRSVNLDAACAPMPRVRAVHALSVGHLGVGDLVIADASEDLDGVGKSVEITSVPADGVVAGLHTIAARFDQTVLANGFKAYLQYNPAFRNRLVQFAAGTKVLGITKSHVSSVVLALPPVAEQRAIAGVLQDSAAGIEMLGTSLVKAQAIKRGMLQQLLAGRTRLSHKDPVC